MEDPLAEEILGAEHPEGSVVKIKMNKSRDGLAFDWQLPETENKKDDSESSGSDDESRSESEKART